MILFDLLLTSIVSADFLKFALPLFGATVAWLINECRKRIWEQYQRKETSYKELIRCLQGFYIGINDANKLKAEFINQLNQCWLYCPDDVIQRAYLFLDTIHPKNIETDEVKEKAMGEFVIAIRKDLLSRKLVRSTRLSAIDFKHLKLNG
jgi:hypothetical protein